MYSDAGVGGKSINRREAHARFVSKRQVSAAYSRVRYDTRRLGQRITSDTHISFKGPTTVFFFTGGGGGRSSKLLERR